MDPSYPIVFYVSGHGFGHASRIIEVIHALLEKCPEADIIVKTAAPRRLFERTLGQRIKFLELQCDVGVIQRDSLHLDPAETIRQARAFHGQMPGKAATEAAFLREAGAGLVIGDIAPLAFAAAAMAGLPSMLIGNFTWDWIYEGYPEESPFDLTRQIRDTYRTATAALRLPMSGGFAGLESITRDIPFVARQSTREPADIRRNLGLPEGRPLLLVSFGGHGLTGLNHRALAGLKDYAIATTDLPGGDAAPATPGIFRLSEQQIYAAGFRYEDLVRAADVVVTKPGYGIISEAIANDTAMLYTSRGRFVEYDVLLKAMGRYLRSQFIDQQDLLDGRWGPALAQLLSQPGAAEKPALNGASIAADAISALSP
jgi:hypothetical protein